jgi:hypothetical protein
MIEVLYDIPILLLKYSLNNLHGDAQIYLQSVKVKLCSKLMQ